MVSSLLEMFDLSLSYKGQQVLNKVSFNLQAGRIMALIGPNGAGKSSCMRILGGFVRPQEGYYMLDKQKNTDFQLLRNTTGYLIETPDFYDYLNARDNLNLLQHLRPKHRSIDELLALVGLADVKNKKIAEFSKGMKQRLGIAQALIGNPQYLILDEPFHGLDMEVKEEMMRMVKKLAKDENKAILISSHLLSDLAKMADDFVLLNKGIIHYKGDVNTIIEQAQRVQFFFIKKVAHQAKALFQPEKILYAGDFRFTMLLNKSQTEEAVKILVRQGFTPYKVEPSSRLEQKYMEMLP